MKDQWPSNQLYYRKDDLIRNNNYRWEDRYLYKEGYKPNYHKDRLKQRYKRRYESNKNINFLKRGYVNQAWRKIKLTYYYCY